MSWLTCFAVFQGFPLQWKNKNNKWDMTLHQNDNRCFIKEKWKDIQYRQGNWQDFSVIFSALWREKMNITGAFSPQYFVIAYLPKDELDVLLGFGQIKPINERARKLASLYVYPEYRNCGIGSAIVGQLLSREKARLSGADGEIYLTCLSRSELFYNKLGFTSVSIDSSIPFSMRLEHYLGSALTKLIEPNEKVLVMRKCLQANSE